MTQSEKHASKVLRLESDDEELYQDREKRKELYQDTRKKEKSVFKISSKHKRNKPIKMIPLERIPLLEKHKPTYHYYHSEDEIEKSEIYSHRYIRMENENNRRQSTKYLEKYQIDESSDEKDIMREFMWRNKKKIKKLVSIQNIDEYLQEDETGNLIKPKWIGNHSYYGYYDKDRMDEVTSIARDHAINYIHDDGYRCEYEGIPFKYSPSSKIDFIETRPKKYHQNDNDFYYPYRQIRQNYDDDYYHRAYYGQGHLKYLKEMEDEKTCSFQHFCVCFMFILIAFICTIAIAITNYNLVSYSKGKIIEREFISGYYIGCRSIDGIATTTSMDKRILYKVLLRYDFYVSNSLYSGTDDSCFYDEDRATRKYNEYDNLPVDVTVYYRRATPSRNSLNRAELSKEYNSTIPWVVCFGIVVLLMFSVGLLCYREEISNHCGDCICHCCCGYKDCLDIKDYSSDDEEKNRYLKEEKKKDTFSYLIPMMV